MNEFWFFFVILVYLEKCVTYSFLSIHLLVYEIFSRRLKAISYESGQINSQFYLFKDNSFTYNMF